MKKIETTTTIQAKETKDVGQKLSSSLRGGDLLLLSGDLGAGKTTFLQGLAKGLGVKEAVNSPTFNILKLYKLKNNQGAKFFCHIDTYRLSGPGDLTALGFEEILASSEYIVAIEWAEKVRELFKSIKTERLVRINLEHINADSRRIKIQSVAGTRKKF